MQIVFSRYIPLTVIAAGFTLLLSCGKESKLNPPLLPDEYSLPQGNQPIDDTIVSFKKRYGTYILYKFSHRDFAYSSGAMLTDTAAPGDPAHIAELYIYFRDNCLSWYPESFRRKALPFKLLFSSAVGSPLPGGAIAPGRGFVSTREMLAIGWANDKLAGLGPVERKALTARMHRYFMTRALQGRSIPVPVEYLALYPISFDGIGESNKYDRGIIEVQNSTTHNVATDIGSFVEAIAGKTTAELEAGILSPQSDRKGLIRRKYNILVRVFMDQYGVDLVAIGNKP
ncbi:hypothetical protein [Chitinophaga deserti]|uniref:hypothetical protein n=1 Tax=Chitinophaga deserti TaxID=2164099 RepID=UPI000D6C8486|nr:hypothetical protein [Chitinophaga deserti]